MLTKQQVSAKWTAALAKEINNNRRSLWWMSFCDPDKPLGQQFLGVIIVEDLGPTHAITKTHHLGINPGGEVVFTQVESGSIKPEHQNRLLSHAELVQFGYVDPAEER